MKPLNIFVNFCTFLLLLCVPYRYSFGQSPDSRTQPVTATQAVTPLPPAYSGSVLNYARSWEAQRPISDEATIVSQSRTNQEVKKSTQYVDGLGRPVQTVAWQVSPAGKDLVAPVIYDELGRETFKYLPYVSTYTDGSFRQDVFNEQNNFLKSIYNPTANADGEKFFYSKTDYESSPLNRVNKVYPQGNSWVGNNVGVATQYLLNNSADEVVIWYVGATNTVPVKVGTYGEGLLSKTLSTDESGNSVAEYKDKEGKVILKKVALSATPSDGHTDWLCTYYVYDDEGNLRFVIQPKATDWLKDNNWTFNGTTWSSSGIAKELCFSYEYDGRNRMIVKRVPGAGEMALVYDARDRLVMTQNANDKALNRWQYTQYDNLNRPVRTGLWITTGDRAYHQDLAQNSSAYPLPTTGNYPSTETYYDDYSWVSSSGSGLSASMITANSITGTGYFYAPSNTTFPYPQGITASTQTKGLVTGTKTRIIGATAFLYTVSFYDDRGRVIQVHSTNYSAGKDTITTQYSFTGQMLRTLVCHGKAGNSPQQYRVLTKMEYDAAGRLTKVYKKAANSPEVTITENTYDELGQLQQKSLGKVRNTSSLNTYTATPLDVIKYDYNIRGWLRGINKDYARNENSADGWFGMELCYDFGFSTSSLNGNISGTRWRSKGDGEQRAYGFSYDAVNRLTGANFTQNTGGTWNISAGVDFSVTALNYDQNGNITKMAQNGLVLNSSKPVDNLSYGYLTNSNRLSYVTDQANDANSTLGDFKEVNNNSTADYSYDNNGNLTKDNNKSISLIQYTHLNNPDSIIITGKGSIKYVYDIVGNKLRKIVYDNTVNPAKTTITDYLGLFTYQNDTLQYIAQEEGRIRPKTVGLTDTMFYDYFEKDHLGNTRIVLTDEKQQDTYPQPPWKPTPLP